MNDATVWRREFIQNVAAPYINHPKTSAVAIGGSVARGWADRHSDVELLVFWREPPSDDERRAVVDAAGGIINIDWAEPPSDDTYRAFFTQTDGRLGQIWPYEDDEWSEHFYVQGVNIGVSGFLEATVNAYFDDLLHHHETDDDKQILMSAIRHSVPLSGEAAISAWKRYAAEFPAGLARAIIQDNLYVSDAWFDIDKAVERGEWLIYHDIFCRMQRTLLRLLLGLNRMYLPDPRIKWTEHIAAEMTIAPRDLAKRLRAVFDDEPQAGIETLQTLWEESMMLVDEQFPDLDTAYARRRLRHRRATRETTPQQP